MASSYFYGSEADQFSFYRIPKVLFIEPKYQVISAEAKILYGILLDRMSLSVKNGWLDKEGRVYIIFTIEAIMNTMGWGNQKVSKLLCELEKKADLIERKRQGLGKPNLIYVKKFLCPDKTHDRKCENNISKDVKETSHEMLESHGNKTDSNKTDKNDTESLPFTSFRKAAEVKRQESRNRSEYRTIISDNIEFDSLLDKHPFEKETLEEILDLLVDVVCSTTQTIRISGDNKPAEVVRNQFLKLNGEHIELVLDSLAQNTTHIRNIKQYLLATLYNALLTKDNYYRSLVNYEMSHEVI